MKERCETCQCWIKPEDPKDKGECRRKAPLPISGDGPLKHAGLSSWWSRTAATEWCMEHVRIPEPVQVDSAELEEVLLKQVGDKPHLPFDFGVTYDQWKAIWAVRLLDSTYFCHRCHGSYFTDQLVPMMWMGMPMCVCKACELRIQETLPFIKTPLKQADEKNPNKVWQCCICCELHLPEEVLAIPRLYICKSCALKVHKALLCSKR